MEKSEGISVGPDTWGNASRTLLDLLGESAHSAWITSLEFDHFDEEANTVVLTAPGDFQKRWVARNYSEQIRAACSDAVGHDVSILITVAGGNQPVDNSHVMPQAPLGPRGASGGLRPATPPAFGAPANRLGTPPPISTPQPVDSELPRLNPRYTFEEFVVGESNRYAHATAMAVAEPTTNSFNPLFLYAPCGLGKTHLMQAIGHEFLRKNPGANVLYTTSERFMNMFIESITEKRPAEFRQRFRSIDLLLLDDVQLLKGKDRTQQEVFHTFNALFDEGKKIVLTSDRPPKEMAELQDRLRSRFEWGLVADIQPPDLETRIAILRHKAKGEGVTLSMDALHYISECVRSSIRELEGALKQVKVYAALHNCPITLDVCRNVLSHLAVGQAANRVNVEDVQRAVCEYFQITASQLMGRNRSRKFSEPRHLALYLSRELTDLSFPDIAQKYGGKDHTTVIYAYRKVKKAISDGDQAVNGVVQHLTRRIQSGQPE